MGYCCFSVDISAAGPTLHQSADWNGDIAAKVHIKFGKPKNIITFVYNTDEI